MLGLLSDPFAEYWSLNLPVWHILQYRVSFQVIFLLYIPQMVGLFNKYLLSIYILKRIFPPILFLNSFVTLFQNQATG